MLTNKGRISPPSRYPSLCPSISQVCVWSWSKHLPLAFKIPPGELVKWRFPGPTKRYGLTKIFREWYLDICILMSSPDSSAAQRCLGSTILRTKVWISAFQPFLPQLIVRNTFTFCPHAYVHIRKGNRSFIKFYLGYILHSGLSYFLNAGCNSLNWFYDSPMGHTVQLTAKLT